MTPIILLCGKARSGKDTAASVLCEELGGQAIAMADPIKRFFMKVGLSPHQLWGDEKEKPIARPDIAPEHCKFWLADVLGYWKTPAQLSALDFGTWVHGLPVQTTPRHLMQSFGTECVRSVFPDLWVDYALYVSSMLLGRREAYLCERGLIPLADAVDPSAPVNVVVITDGRFRNEAVKVSMAGGQTIRLMRSEGEELSAEAKQHSSETSVWAIPGWWFDNTVFNDGTLDEFERTVTELAGAIVEMGITQFSRTVGSV